MKISTRGLYGVRAMFDLALQYRMGPVSVEKISRRQSISVSYLEQLFNKMRRDGLVESVRGPGGGYRLTRQPKSIKIGDIIRSLEGPLLFEEPPARETGLLSGKIVNRMWQNMREDISSAFDSRTLEDLCREARTLENSHSKAFSRSVK